MMGLQSIDARDPLLFASITIFQVYNFPEPLISTTISWCLVNSINLAAIIVASWPSEYDSKLNVNVCKIYSNISVHVRWNFHQNRRAGDFRTLFFIWEELPVTLLLSEFYFFQCIDNRKLRGLERPLNLIQSSYKIARYISVSKRNLK